VPEGGTRHYGKGPAKGHTRHFGQGQVRRESTFREWWVTRGMERVDFAALYQCPSKLYGPRERAYHFRSNTTAQRLSPAGILSI
jgi:hypothetical protein